MAGQPGQPVQIAEERQGPVALSDGSTANVGVVGLIDGKVALDVRVGDSPTGQALVTPGGRVAIGGDQFTVTPDTVAATGIDAITLTPAGNDAAPATSMAAVRPVAPTPTGAAGATRSAQQGTQPTISFGDTSFAVGIVAASTEAIIFSYRPISYVPPDQTADARITGTHFLRSGDTTTINGVVVKVEGGSGSVRFTPYG